jgi:hypothetical protein
MRTKTTLLCAAALAAGVTASMAQSNVYSLNIVGYANVPNPKGYSFQSSPFEASPSDAATNVIANPNTVQAGTYPGPMDGSSLQLWTGTGFTIYEFDSETSDTTTGFTTPGAAPVVGPTLGSGLGYLINNGNAGGSNNITYVGTVRTGTNALVFPVAIKAYAIGSPLPLAGGVSSVLGMANPNTVQAGTYPGPLDGSSVEFLKVSPAGQALGYTIVEFDSETSDTTTGFTDTSAHPVAEPQVPIGGGYFFSSDSPHGAYTWTQILNP